jgi:serine/threonine protein kinase
MSEKGSGGEPSPDDDDESDGSEVESWLRLAARVAPSDARIPLPQIGQVIGGKYRIEEQLGKGGMGAVYRATHVVSDKPVALKWMLRPASDERALERFTREARAAGRIDHPNVVDVYDIGQDGDAGYLVMELLRGESLRHRLARGPLAPTAVVDLLLPAMRGVAAAHREGVIHRDLKPDNIFLCRAPDGAEREAKVLDFGISTINVLDADAQTRLTKEGTVLGTPSYMSPEQLHSVRDVDARTDVYAFAVILYEALTGSIPFVGDSYSALVLAIANTKPRPPRELRPAIPLQLERVVLRAMEKDRATRVQSMDALISALLPFASVKSTGSGEQASVELQRATLPSARRSSRAVAIAMALLVLASLSWWLTRERTPLVAADHREPASSSEAAAPPPVAAPAVMNAPRVEQARDAPAPPAAPATAAPASQPEPTVRERPRHGERASRTPAEPRTTAPTVADVSSVPPKQAPAPAPARSGSIKLDDL